MINKPEVNREEDGSVSWENVFEDFEVRVYKPLYNEEEKTLNYGFVSPYLIVFEEEKRTLDEAVEYAKNMGLSSIASRTFSSVISVYPTCSGGWKNAPADIFEKIISQSKICQYYEDAMAVMRDRFTGEWGEYYIRGAVLRTFLYGKGKSADYIASNCLKTVYGDGLYGKGDITPVVCVLEGLNVMPEPERRDIPVVSIGNSDEINDILRRELDYTLIKEYADCEKDYDDFGKNFRRMVGYLEIEDDFDKIGMVREPGIHVVTTSPDNRGDDSDTKTHKVGYFAFYNKKIKSDGKKVPLMLCFHGGGDSAICMATLSGWYKIAHENNFLLVAVENHLNSTATEMMELIEHLKDRYPVDTEKIYSTGFSMGGCKSWDMYQEYPEVFAGVAPMDATYDVGLNSYGKEIGTYNTSIIVPVFYAGGEETPLPELPFQEIKCLNRMKYVLEVNNCVTKNEVEFESQDVWPNIIWGIDGDFIEKDIDVTRDNAVLTMNYFKSEDGECYSVFASISGQEHEVRHHTCDHAWKFLKKFRRKNGAICIE